MAASCREPEALPDVLLRSSGAGRGTQLDPPSSLQHQAQPTQQGGWVDWEERVLEPVNRCREEGFSFPTHLPEAKGGVP